MAPWSRPTIKGASLAMLAALGCLVALGNNDPRTGTPIRCELDTEMFPASWRTPEIDPKAVPVDKPETFRSQICAEVALSHYPVDLVKKNLKAVYFAKQLSFYGVAFGGTNSRDTIYLANQGEAAGYTGQYLVSAFHHEFSSILLRNYWDNFDEAGWMAANAPGTGYREGGVIAVRDGTSDLSFKPKFNVNGYLNEYSTASLEEDFNTVAEALFSGDRTFWVLCDRYPRLGQKKDLAVKFYGSLDPQFSEAYFRGLAK
jgi:hypothetical protein